MTVTELCPGAELQIRTRGDFIVLDLRRILAEAGVDATRSNCELIGCVVRAALVELFGAVQVELPDEPEPSEVL